MTSHTAKRKTEFNLPPITTLAFSRSVFEINCSRIKTFILTHLNVAFEQLYTTVQRSSYLGQIIELWILKHL